MDTLLEKGNTRQRNWQQTQDEDKQYRETGNRHRTKTNNTEKLTTDTGRRQTIQKHTNIHKKTKIT
jgi:hypothetical protein